MAKRQHSDVRGVAKMQRALDRHTKKEAKLLKRREQPPEPDVRAGKGAQEVRKGMNLFTFRRRRCACCGAQLSRDDGTLCADCIPRNLRLSPRSCRNSSVLLHVHEKPGRRVIVAPRSRPALYSAFNTFRWPRACARPRFAQTKHPPRAKRSAMSGRLRFQAADEIGDAGDPKDLGIIEGLPPTNYYPLIDFAIRRWSSIVGRYFWANAFSCGSCPESTSFRKSATVFS